MKKKIKKLFFKIYRLFLQMFHIEYLSLKIFNPYGYSIIYAKELEETKLSPLDHYIKYGIKRKLNRGNKPSKDLFYKKGYSFLYKDEIGDQDPWVHYCLYGFQQNYNNGVTPPTDVFDPLFYLNSNEDVLKSGMDPWEHYVTFGYKENRIPKEDSQVYYDLIKNSAYFDPIFYKNNNMDLFVIDDLDPIMHYMCYGYRENRNPSPNFNAVEYARNLNLAPTINPLLHYEKIGKFEINTKLVESLTDNI